MTARAIDVRNKVVTEVQSLSGATSGLTFTAESVWSWGYSDGDLSSIRVPVRVWDLAWDTADIGNERDDYEVQIGLQKLVSRKAVADIDTYFNLFILIAGLYPIDRQITIGSGKVLVQNKRTFPLMIRSSDIMDSSMPTTKMMMSLIVNFREWVDE